MGAKDTTLQRLRKLGLFELLSTEQIELSRHEALERCVATLQPATR